MRILSALLLAGALYGTACTTVAAGPCGALDTESKKALGYLIDDAYGLGKVQAEDPEEQFWANRVLESKGRAILPCLISVYHNGVHGELWDSDKPEPSSGRWTLSLIRRIDPQSSVPLYKQLYQEAADPLARAQLAAELFGLGESAYQAEVLSFLNAPPAVPTNRSRDLSQAQARALAAIAEQNFRPALPILQRLNLRDDVKDKHVLAVYIAQLSGDAAAVEAAVGDTRVRDKVLLALKRMGKEDRLRAIANNPGHPAHEAAGLVLSGRIRG